MENRRSFLTTTSWLGLKEKNESLESGTMASQDPFPDPAPNPTPDPDTVKKAKARGDYYRVSVESSHTKFYKKNKIDQNFEVVSRNEFLSISESISGSSDSYQCVHGLEGKKYTEKGLLKRNLLKELDPIPVDRNWTEECPPVFEWQMAEKLEFLVLSPTVEQQIDRLQAHLLDFANTSSNGYRVDCLNSFCVILNFLMENVSRLPVLKESLVLLLQNLQKPILLKACSDVITYFEEIRHYLGYIGYLLIRIDEDQLFDLVSKAIIWHLSAPDTLRGPGTAQLRHTLAAAAPVLQQTIVRMIAVATSHRFPTFLEIALLLACDTEDNCIEMMKENIIENIFYRFNPYMFERLLPNYDINPHDCQDYNVKLGDSSVNMSTTLSLLLVLAKTTKQYLKKNPKHGILLPAPDCYSQRCFIWAYRYECRAREHRHERITLTVIATVLLKIYSDKLLLFSSILMAVPLAAVAAIIRILSLPSDIIALKNGRRWTVSRRNWRIWCIQNYITNIPDFCFMVDVISLSVLTELPPRSDWVGTVNFNTAQQDVQFKKTLILFVVDLLKVFPYNTFMMETRHWMLGIMYLLDPGLCHLRSRWAPSLFAELRKTALQALVCALPLMEHRLIKQYGLIRRIMWYIEWYSESPYEISILYWCVRVLQVATYYRQDVERSTAIKDLFETHGIIILIHLCYTLMDKKLPPVEKSQAVLALSLRLLTSAVISNKRLTCCVYPTIKWPLAVNTLAKKMLDVVLFSLDKHFIMSDRWLISLLNFIWEAIIWKKEYREKFVINDGIYKLLDIVTMTKPPVQCIALALVCDVARAGDAVGQLVSWRANLGASNAFPNLVTRGATIASLLAAVFRDGCRSTGVRLDEYGVLQDLEFPIMSVDTKAELYNIDYRYIKSHRTPICLAAAELAGSSMSKAFAILHLLSNDLEERVSLADEAYNLYKNIKLGVEDEVILVLCSHYLTLKLSEVWKETKVQSIGLVPYDDNVLDDFICTGKGWAKEIKRQQEDVLDFDRKKETEEESSLYAFLGRIRLNVALDALRAVRCVARSADRHRITHALLHDAVFAHHRRKMYAEKTNATPLRTYRPPLDDQNITGQNVKVISIEPKQKFMPLEFENSSETSQSSE